MLPGSCRNRVKFSLCHEPWGYWHSKRRSSSASSELIPPARRMTSLFSNTGFKTGSCQWLRSGRDGAGCVITIFFRCWLNQYPPSPEHRHEISTGRRRTTPMRGAISGVSSALISSPRQAAARKRRMVISTFPFFTMFPTPPACA